MPRLDLILLPLLGGYIFLVTFNLTKYYHLRLERQKLIYNSLVSAVILSMVVYLIDYFLLQSDKFIVICNFKVGDISFYRSWINEYVSDIFKFKPTNGLKHAILVFVISWPLARFLNLFFSREFAFDYTIERWGNQLDRLIWFSLAEKKDEDKLLMITTKSRKVYIGYINRISEPLGENHINLIPSFSGYRDNESLDLRITISYTDVIKKYVEEDRADKIDKLGIVFPVNEILFVSKFDLEIFGRFNKLGDSAKKSPKNGIIKSFLSCSFDFLQKLILKEK
ncbi:hypothetical protein MM239_11355 [Belliella sp. DSM 111904]|uniref:Uncharacterized protein n=1 Tax=Belliella filtrata TaxID=2923435 RepID=A0ABS9V0Q2_9BACT|nr:hypothetical protein [Belliella filtrata]MCH7409992.1 hypothetical protein [Belliella filtrata]